LLAQGFTISEIARRCRKAPSTVAWWMEKHGLEPVHRKTHARLEISRDGVTLSLEAVRLEARKCVLVCSNCHAEVEAGVTTVPVE
jgi:hypothetical protein